jgi:hypothetical protein
VGLAGSLPQKTPDFDSSEEKKKLLEHKRTLGEKIPEQLKPVMLLSIVSQTIAGFIKDLDEVSTDIKAFKEVPVVKNWFLNKFSGPEFTINRSMDKCTNEIDKAINALSVAHNMLVIAESNSKEPKVVADARREFYDYVTTCRDHLSAAMEYFLAHVS